jgi:hypothetical protein
VAAEGGGACINISARLREPKVDGNDAVFEYVWLRSSRISPAMRQNNDVR